MSEDSTVTTGQGSQQGPGLNNTSNTNKKIQALVLDAGPLITQPASSLQQHAQTFFTTPGVYGELKDDAVRQQLVIWGDNLKIRHPKPASIKRVTDFSKLTGDYAVLSANDLHIIALAYELECELNNGDWRLRKTPGQKLEFHKKSELKDTTSTETPSSDNVETEAKDNSSKEEGKPKKPRRRGGKKQREKREAQIQKELEELSLKEEEKEEVEGNKEEKISEAAEIKNTNKESENLTNNDTDATNLEEDYDEEDDDGDWITPENLKEEILKDSREQISESTKNGPFIKVAISTGDFACQNVSMQLGLNLMNSMSGKQIKRVRNYMYRCHACFKLTAIPKDGTPKHFCPKCGGATLLRCAVSVDTLTGKVTPHLKANFQWYKRGDRYTLPSPQSKNQRKLLGNGGYQHNKDNRNKGLQNEIYLREDQKEYQQAIKDDAWQRKQNEKILSEWIGGGSADNYMSPFSTYQGMRPSGVRIGKGRFANSSRRK